jgi:cell division protein FtsI (penicillin-binding protein 3)
MPRRSQSHQKTRWHIDRAQVIMGFFVVIGLIFSARLFTIQAIKADDYRTLADREQLKKFSIPANRGEIYLNDGNNGPAPLVLNEPVYTIYADPQYVGDGTEETLKQLQDVLVNPNNDIASKLAKKTSRYEVLQQNVSLAEKKAIESKQLKGIGAIKDTRRVYPEGTLAAQTIGFVNQGGSGQYGIEQMLNKELAGTAGRLSGATDVRGVPIATENNISQTAVDGKNVLLTIDRPIQAQVESALVRAVQRNNADSASAVVIDVHNGHVLAMANAPTFDPSNYKQANNRLFQNGVVTNAYEAGSVIKVFSMATGLESGAVTPEHEYFDNWCVTIDSYKVCNAGKTPKKQKLSMTQVITNSANTGAIHVLEQLGGGDINATAKQKLYEDFANKYHFGQLRGIEQTGETKGYLAPAKGSSDIRYANMTFGQGISTSMLQVASSTAALINGGTLYKPTLVDTVTDIRGKETKHSPEVLQSDVVSKETSNQIKAMMLTVTEKGSGYNARREGFKIGAKTGTAEIANPSGGYYKGKYNGSMIGFSGINDPKYVIMVRVENPRIEGYAGPVAAGPLFADINNWLIDYYGLQPGE